MLKWATEQVPSTTDSQTRHQLITWKEQIKELYGDVLKELDTFLVNPTIST